MCNMYFQPHFSSQYLCFFLLIYLQTLGLKALYGTVSLLCTVLICSYVNFEVNSLKDMCKLTGFCEHSIFLILIAFLIM